MAYLSKETAVIGMMKNSHWDTNTGCLLFAGAQTKTGYGRVLIFRSLTDKQMVEHTTHRLALEVHLGRALRGAVLHSCDTPRCINPLHLREGTVAENHADMVSRGRQSTGHRTSHLSDQRRATVIALIGQGLSNRRISIVEKTSIHTVRRWRARSTGAALSAQGADHE